MQTQWSVLFVRSASPGAVFRLLERNRASIALPDSLLLSEPIAPQGWRILTAADSPDISLVPPGKLLSVAFPPSATLLFCDGRAWGYQTWQKGEATAEHSEALPAASPVQKALSALPGLRLSEPPYIVWARAQGFPAGRIPALARSEKASVVAYRTVSSLDERGLLIENSPRFYRFPLLPE